MHVRKYTKNIFYLIIIVYLINLLIIIVIDKIFSENM